MNETKLAYWPTDFRLNFFNTYLNAHMHNIIVSVINMVKSFDSTFSYLLVFVTTWYSNLFPHEMATFRGAIIITQFLSSLDFLIRPSKQKCQIYSSSSFIRFIAFLYTRSILAFPIITFLTWNFRVNMRAFNILMVTQKGVL